MGEWANIVGTTIQTLAILGTVGGFIFRLHLDNRLLLEKLTQSNIRIVKVEDEVKQLSQVVVSIARQDTRLDNVEARLQEISNRLYDHIKRQAA